VALLRSKQKQQVIEKLKSVAPPGETFLACVHCETGPSPWLNLVFDEVPFLSLIVALLRNYYFITLTNTSVVINSANRFTNRPGDVVFSFPRDAFPIERVKRASLWSSMYVRLPNKETPTRLNINRYWRTEFDQLMGGLPAPAPLPEATATPPIAAQPASEATQA
jgi:hypothetical protein